MNIVLSIEERALLRGKQIQMQALQTLQGWYPVVIGNNGLWWQFFGEKKFSEPFFHDTVGKLGQIGERLCTQTSFDALDTLGDTLAPSAFIFHISRCGSTLLTQLLSSLPQCIVMSEPPVIDSFLRRYHAGMDQGEAEKSLRQIVSALGQKRFAAERHLFIKLDSWHIGSLPLFRKAFPDTPFLFMYREPEQVLASHRRQRGRQMVPGLVNAAMPQHDFTLTAPGDLDAYCVNMLGYFFNSACQFSDELIFVNYQQMPNIVWDKLLDFFVITASPDQLETLKSRSGRHSKKLEVFSGDPQAISSGHGDACVSLYPSYERLEQLRLSQNKF